LDIYRATVSSLKKLGIEFTKGQVSLLMRYLEIIYNYNMNTNIVGTKKKEDILVRHFLDCLSILKYRKSIFGLEDECKKILDIGTGAGLPGMLLAIFMKNKKFYLMDKKIKKISFLEKTIEALNLSNVTLIRSKAEELAHDSSYRENYDLVLARAVAKINILSELAIPFCKINGKIVFYKSKKVFNEVISARHEIAKLGGRVYSLKEVNVPELNEFRIFMIITKEKSTPCKYPRSIAKINKISKSGS
jgi:16S rRNA (guanine527-N7)-methyltransferase